MTLIEKIDKMASDKCNELVKNHPQTWYHIDGYRALIWLTPWGESGGRSVHPEYIITKDLKCVHLDYYPFIKYLDRALNIIPGNIGYAERQLKNLHWPEYMKYCSENNYLAECK